MLLNSFLKEEKGQAVLETAAVLPLFLLLVMGMITFGLLIHTKMTVLVSASQGARVGAQIWHDDSMTLEEKEEKIEKVVFGMLSEGINGTDRKVTIEEVDGSLHVKLEYDYKLILPFLNAVFKEDKVPIEYEAIYYIEG